MRKAKIRLRRLLSGKEITGDEQVWPTVVVVIEEPSRKTAGGCLHSCDFGNICEGGVVVVVIQDIGPAKIRKKEIRIAVIVVIASRNALHVADVVDSGRVRNIFTRAVSLIQEKLSGTVFVADEQVHKAIIIDINPGGGLRT